MVQYLSPILERSNMEFPLLIWGGYNCSVLGLYYILNSLVYFTALGVWVYLAIDGAIYVHLF